MTHYDAIVIGAGQAGVPLAKRLAKAGKNTALIEKRFVGGTCINDGCTPTKTMIASARAAYLAGKCTNLGVHIESFSVDLKQAEKRKDKIVLDARNGSQRQLEETKNLDLVFGTAAFTADKKILVTLNDGGTAEMSADLFFIDTGTTPVIPEIDGIEDVPYLTSTSILELDSVPEHLLVLGGNYIGLEFGQMFKRFGSKVTILEKSRSILSREDADVSGNLHEILEEEKIRILTSAVLKKVRKKGSGIQATIMVAGKEQTLSCTHMLVAIGRTPQTKALRLENTGVKTDDKGYIKVNGKLETSRKGIYALGDVKGGPAFTHIAYNDYTIVYRNLFEKGKFSTRGRPVPYCMFTDPQLGRIGLTEKEAVEQGYKIKVAKLSMEHVARARETGETRGLMKAVVDAKTRKILGAAIIGEQGGEIVSVLQMAMQGNITYDRIRYCVFAHPTYSESLNNLFMEIEE